MFYLLKSHIVFILGTIITTVSLHPLFASVCVPITLFSLICVHTLLDARGIRCLSSVVVLELPQHSQLP